MAQIWCLFMLPKKARARWFTEKFPHDHFAYVEWFTPFSSSRFDRHSKMYRVSRIYNPASKGGQRKASIVPISLIRESIHLFPKFGVVAPPPRLAQQQRSRGCTSILCQSVLRPICLLYRLLIIIFYLYLLQFILLIENTQ